MNRNSRPLRFERPFVFLAVALCLGGSMEIPEQRDANRRLRDVLTEQGYALDYSEFNGNHSYLGWRTDLARRLVNLAP